MIPDDNNQAKIEINDDKWIIKQTWMIKMKLLGYCLDIYLLARK